MSSTKKHIPMILIKIQGTSVIEDLEVYRKDQRIYGPVTLIDGEFDLTAVGLSINPNERMLLSLKMKNSFSEDTKILIERCDIVDNATGIMESIEDVSPLVVKEK